MSGRRGRPSRAGSPANCSLRVPLTRAEKASIVALARRHGHSVADFVRLVLLDAAAESGDDLMLVTGISEHENRRLRDD